MDSTKTPEFAAAELEDLKGRADLLGIKYHPSIGADKLLEKIKEHQAAVAAEEAARANGSSSNPGLSTPPASPNAPVAPAPAPAVETDSQKRTRIRADAERLIRIRVTCLNPAKKEWPGEIFSVGNRAVGTLKKFVPFNADEGWHVPNMIYQMMKSRECQVFITTKQKNGIAVRKGKMIREFAIEVMDPLTKQELDDLARVQAMSAGQEA